MIDGEYHFGHILMSDADILPDYCCSLHLCTMYGSFTSYTLIFNSNEYTKK